MGVQAPRGPELIDEPREDVALGRRDPRQLLGGEAPTLGERDQPNTLDVARGEASGSVVVQELRAGVRGRAGAKLESAIVAPFERHGRLITPTYAAWKETGRVLGDLTRLHARQNTRQSRGGELLEIGFFVDVGRADDEGVAGFLEKRGAPRGCAGEDKIHP